LLLAACADPAVLEVKVSIDDADLTDLVLVVAKGTADGDRAIDCTLPFGAEPKGTCGFDDGTGRWTDRASLGFVLYGAPATDLYFRIDGRRARMDALDVVTTTTAVSALPPNPGERALLELPLPNRTKPRFRCSVDLPGAGDPDLSSLVVLDRIDPVSIVAAVRDRMSLVRYGGGNGASCSLDVVRTVDLPCVVHPSALVARLETSRGTAGSGSLLTVAGLCDDEPRGMARLFALRVGEGDLLQTFTNDVDAPRAKVSRPALTYRPPAITAVVETRSGPGVLTWTLPTQASPEATLIVSAPGLVFPAAAARSPVGPIVVPPAMERQPVAVAGYGGPIHVVEPCKQAIPVDGASLRGAAAYVANERVYVAEVRGADLAVHAIAPTGSRTPCFQVTTERSALMQPAEEALDVRIAIGLFGAGKEPFAVVASEGFVELHPIDGGVASGFVASSGFRGAQSTLLWNMDGLPGDEIITYEESAGSFYGHTAGGAPLDGWDPLTTTNMDGDPRLALSGAFELPTSSLAAVTLSGGTLEVIVLGPSSVTANNPGWPQPSRDAAATGTWTLGARQPVSDQPR
jgi:hypothetical protein